MRILIIEDEKKVAQALQQGLVSDGYEARIAGTGEEGFFLLNTEHFDLIILDWMLPKRDGIEVLKAVRDKGVATPVLMLTARDAVEDRVLGLDSGADDYLVKPFAFAELLARIRSLLRRGGPDRPSLLNIADLKMDVSAKQVIRQGRIIHLTLREFELLEFLMRYKNTVVTREMITREVWKETNRATPLDNVIDVHMVRLRKKMDDPFNIKLLHTVRGVGFVLRVGEK
jgi:two-component system copper resistance phosphate regulon response regulator CusR